MAERIDPKAIVFRRLRIEDLPLLVRWLNEPHVREWYDRDRDVSLVAVTERYAPKIRREKPTDSYLVFYQEKPVGYIQTYLVNDYPEYGPFLGLNDDLAAGIDLFIGEPSLVGRGLGSNMVRKFVDEVVFADPRVNICTIGPEPGNSRAIHAYEKAGFHFLKTVQIPGENHLTHLMWRSK